jgi:hypothetical protein
VFFLCYKVSHFVTIDYNLWIEADKDKLNFDYIISFSVDKLWLTSKWL